LLRESLPLARLGGWLVREFDSSGFIYPLPQDTRSFKNHHAASSEDKVLLGLRVAAAAGIFVPDAEFAKAADQDVFFPGQGVFNNIQNAFHGTASFLFVEPELEINVIDNLFFSQCHGLKLLALI
jgi:hypothetical protein